MSEFILEVSCGEDDCPFEGNVTVWEDGDVWGWVCPVCGFEHENDYSNPDDDEWDDNLEAF